MQTGKKKIKEEEEWAIGSFNFVEQLTFFPLPLSVCLRCRLFQHHSIFMTEFYRTDPSVLNPECQDGVIVNPEINSSSFQSVWFRVIFALISESCWLQPNRPLVSTRMSFCKEPAEIEVQQDSALCCYWKIINNVLRYCSYPKVFYFFYSLIKEWHIGCVGGTVV